jgi:hypothetical protein
VAGVAELVIDSTDAGIALFVFGERRPDAQFAGVRVQGLLGE